jgi:hypothetical protein
LRLMERPHQPAMYPASIEFSAQRVNSRVSEVYSSWIPPRRADVRSTMQIAVSLNDTAVVVGDFEDFVGEVFRLTLLDWTATTRKRSERMAKRPRSWIGRTSPAAASGLRPVKGILAWMAPRKYGNGSAFRGSHCRGRVRLTRKPTAASPQSSRSDIRPAPRGR